MGGSMFHMTNNPNNTLQRRVLHVQSQSSWAPLCIGPYSQAQCIYDTLIFISGQIALDPNTMKLIESLPSSSSSSLSSSPSSLSVEAAFHIQVDQCIRNISRILIPLHCNLLHMFMLIAYVDVTKVHMNEDKILILIRDKLQIHMS